MTKEFVSKEAHFGALLAQLPEEKQGLYASMRHLRSESLYAGRTFIVYTMTGRECRVLEEFEVVDFELNDEDGASTVIRSKESGKRLKVGYAPVQFFDHPLFVFLPLYCRARWCATQEMAGHKGSLAWDMVLRTQSRRHLQERNVTYCETGVVWSEEFEGDNAIQGD